MTGSSTIHESNFSFENEEARDATKTRHLISLLLLAGVSLAFASTAFAQAWKPERNVELVIPTSPGGSNDIAGRTLHKLLNDLKLLPVSSSVANRSGGEHNVAYTYVSQRTGDAHTIGVMSTPMLVNAVEGRSQLTHNDVSPIAYLFTEPMIVLVRADSPLKTGRDVIDALRKNPGAAETKKWLDEEFAALKSAMTELGLIRQP